MSFWAKVQLVSGRMHRGDTYGGGWMRKCQVYPVLYVKRKYHLSAISLYRKVSGCVPVALPQLQTAFVIRDFHSKVRYGMILMYIAY